MDRVSDNFTAELLVKELGAVQAGHGTTAAGVGFITGLLAQAGVPLAGVRLVDGSGLSLLDRLTPEAVASLLTTMWNDVDVRLDLLSSLPVAGRTGTLHDRHARRSRDGRRAREDRHDVERVRALRLRRRPLRLLDPPERLATRVVVGPRRAGSVRDGASRPQ